MGAQASGQITFTHPDTASADLGSVLEGFPWVGLVVNGTSYEQSAVLGTVITSHAHCLVYPCVDYCSPPLTDEETA